MNSWRDVYLRGGKQVFNDGESMVETAHRKDEPNVVTYW